MKFKFGFKIDEPYSERLLEYPCYIADELLWEPIGQKELEKMFYEFKVSILKELRSAPSQTKRTIE